MSQERYPDAYEHNEQSTVLRTQQATVRNLMYLMCGYYSSETIKEALLKIDPELGDPENEELFNALVDIFNSLPYYKKEASGTVWVNYGHLESLRKIRSLKLVGSSPLKVDDDNESTQKTE